MAAYAIQFRRGTTTQHNSFTGLLGEVTVDTDKKTLVVHDGSTTGGFPLAREGAASNASTGSFTSNVTIGGTLAVTSTASFSDDVSITGDLGMTGHIIPSANITYDLGSTTMMWRDIYVGPGSLYVNGKKVIEDNAGTIQITTDINQNLKVETTGTGTLQLSSAGGITVNGELNALTGDITFGDHINLQSNLLKNVGTPVSGADAANKTYVDTTISSQLAGGTLAVDATTGDFSGDVAIGGSLTVTGTVTTVNSETIELADNILLLNSNALGNASQSGGIEVERGDDLNVQLLWDETNDRWSVGSEDFKAATFIGNLTGDVTGTVSSLSNHDTADLAEGSNLYWTEARGTANFDANLALADTGDMAEGTNLYYTNARARSAISVSGDLSYDASTGVISTQGLASSDSDDLSEGSVNRYFTSARETAITTAYQAYADQAEVDAKAYTDTRETDITTAYQAYADQAEVDAKAYTDTRETAITTAYQSYADTAEVDAKAYTDTRETAITTAYQAYADQAEADAESAAATYTDAREVAITGVINALDTDDIAEGSTNLYHTTARARAAISASGSLSYNSTTGEMSFTMPAQNTTAITEGDNLYYTDARADARVANATGVNLDLSNQDTGDLAEGSNQYFTNARAVAAVEASITHFHSAEQTVTAAVSTANATASVSFTFSELAGADHYAVYLNRQLLRPGEFTANGNATNNLTISTGILAEDDELEVVGFKL